MKKTIFTLLMVLFASGQVLAIPNLQLDISGGTYDPKSETIVASDNVFSLYALMQDSSKTSLDQTYFISAALTPKDDLSATSGANAGSFNFNGTTINATSGMVFGVPPLELYLPFDSNDLSKHDIFETYYTEFSFKFDPNMMVDAYNTADGSPVSGKIYQKEFNVDLTNLADGYGIHFDLYSEVTKEVAKRLVNTDVDVDRDEFAPFSHDAMGIHRTPPEPVPEPSTMILLGIGLLGLAVYGKGRLNHTEV